MRRRYTSYGRNMYEIGSDPRGGARFCSFDDGIRPWLLRSGKSARSTEDICGRKNNRRKDSQICCENDDLEPE